MDALNVAPLKWATNEILKVESSNDIARWHPKISPYRFIVLSTTIGLGTAKILEIHRGGSSIPTTLEWVGGSVLSIMFFSVSSYDSADHNNKPPHWLQWLFLSDCMNIIWGLFSLCSLRQPHYITTEKASHAITYPQPPTTAYRILVCAMVITFGLGKAVLSYLNLKYPVAAWMDWTLGVPVFTILYCIGLYEYNSVDLFSSFFIVDRSEYLFSAFTGVSHISILILCAGWSYLYAYASTFITYQPSLLSELWSSSDNDLVFMKLIGHDILYAGALAGILACVLIFRKIVVNMTSRQGMVRRIAFPVFTWFRQAVFGRKRESDAWASDEAVLYELREMQKVFKNSPPKYYGPQDKGNRTTVIFTPQLDLAFYVLIHVTTSLMGVVFFALLAMIVPHAQWTLQRPSSLSDAVVWLFHLMGIAMSWFWALGLMAYALALTLQVVAPFNLTLSLPNKSRKKQGTMDDSVVATQNGQSDSRWIQREKLIGLGPFKRLL